MKPDRPAAAPVEIDEAGLLAAARTAKRGAYVPYSSFPVGCAVLSASGAVHTGANVENAAYPLSSCAEQTTINAMVAAGDLGPILAVAVVGDGDDPLTPCGGCRQVINEFGPRALVLGAGDGGRPLRTTLPDLLPHAFGPVRLAQRGDA
jgi:cytidine deaminase